MYHGFLRTALLVVAALLAGTIGCKSDQQQSSPGALPRSPSADATPRLNASTYFAHGHLLERQGNYEQAAEQYYKALDLTPDFLSARNRLGITLNKLGRHVEATAQFRRAIEQAPTQAHLHNNLGFSLYLENLPELAAEALRRALELRPDYNRARMNYGVVLAKLGQWDDALAEFTLAAGKAAAHYNLGVIQTELGDFAAATRSLEQALRLDPDFDAARQQLLVVARLQAEPWRPPAQDRVVAQDTPTARPPKPRTRAQTSPHPRTAAKKKSPTHPPLVLERPVRMMSPAEVRAKILARLAVYTETHGVPSPLAKNVDSPGAAPVRQSDLSAGIRKLVAAANSHRHAEYDRLMAKLQRQLAALQRNR